MSVQPTSRFAHDAATMYNQEGSIANLLGQNNGAINTIFMLSVLNLAPYFFNRVSAQVSSGPLPSPGASDETGKMLNMDYPHPTTSSFLRGSKEKYEADLLRDQKLDKEICDILGICSDTADPHPTPSPFPAGSKEKYEADLLRDQKLDQEICNTLDICGDIR
jgi:hypothetical protein